jgi:uncharacterized protein
MAKKTPNKVVVDTNIWISFLIGKKIGWLKELFFDRKKINLIICDELLEEIINVAKRKSFRKYFSEEDISEIIFILSSTATFQDVKTEVKICTDEADNFLLGLCEDSKADYLVTGDVDLLVLKKHHKTVIAFS